MATDVWALSAIATPAGTHRIPIATGSNTGGYSLRSEFVYRDSSGDYKMTESQFPRLVFERAAIGTWSLGYDGQAGSNSFALRLNGGASVLNVSTSGLVGIGLGNAVASAKLHIKGSGEQTRYETTVARGGGSNYLRFTDPTGSSGFVGFTGADNTFTVHNELFGAMQFVTNALTRVTINTSGHFGIGVSPSARLHVQSSGQIARFETTTARGSGNGFVMFADPTGDKGYVGYGGGTDKFYIVNSLNADLTFGTNNFERWGITAGGNFYPTTDNTYSMGTSGNRIAVVYAATGTINTSDANDKDWLGTGFSPELLSAAKRISAEIGSYKWLDAIQRETEGGPAARIHFGVRAQAVWEIMADEGLIDPLQEGVTPSSPYAFLCWDEEEDRPEGRFGIRPDQLTLFLIAAQEARIAALEDLLP